MLIGITGNIGSGKSGVAKKLGDLLGAVVLDADLMCRELMEPGNAGFQAFLRQGGERFLDSAGALDRVALRGALFSDPVLRKNLESILHPMVRKEILVTCSGIGKESGVVAEIPLLYESGWTDDFDIIIAVRADEKKLMERVVERDGGKPENVREILDTQMGQDEKCLKADHVIDNSGSWDRTEKQIADLAEILRRKNRESTDHK